LKICLFPDQVVIIIPPDKCFGPNFPEGKTANSRVSVLQHGHYYARLAACRSTPSLASTLCRSCSSLLCLFMILPTSCCSLCQFGAVQHQQSKHLRDLTHPCKNARLYHRRPQTCLGVSMFSHPNPGLGDLWLFPVVSVPVNTIR